MQKQITEKTQWYLVETDVGNEYLLKELFSEKEQNSILLNQEDEERFNSKIIGPFLEGFCIYNVSEITGHGCRMISPGFTDCTEWSVFDTVEECEGNLEHLYGDE